MSGSRNGAAHGAAPPRHFLDIADFSGSELRHVLDASAAIKARRRRGELAAERPLLGKTLAMVFDKPSTRTRVSFDVAMRELGGETIMLTGKEMQLGRGETVADTARVLSRYVDAIMIRTLDHTMLAELASAATVPVINGLTKVSHPCQIMADVLTFEEHKGPIRGRTVAWTGDSNNVLASWLEAAARLDFRMRVATPAELAPPPEMLAFAEREGADVVVGTDPFAAVAEADAIVTDCWVSMGDEDEAHRHNLLAPYQVNERLMAASSKNPIFMHCLPAHRGEEVTDAVMDGPRSVVFDEAENRLHAQKGILAWCFGKTGGSTSVGAVRTA
jgi:ornithine carbamoyltransferase